MKRLVAPFRWSTSNQMAMWAALAGLLFAWLDRFGPGMTHDSLLYASGAQAILEGTGFWNVYFGTFQPDRHLGPLYPGLLAAVAWLIGTSSWEVVGIQYLLMAVNLWLVSRLLLSQNLAKPLVWLLVLGLPLCEPFRMIHTHAWSEPLFLLLFLSALQFVRQPYSYGRLWLMAVLMGLAVLTRFAGMFVLPFFVGLIWLQPGLRWQHKLRQLLWFGSWAILPFLGWTLRNALGGAGALGNRTWNYDPVELAFLLKAFRVYAFWFLLSLPLLWALVRAQWDALSLWLLAYPFVYVGFLWVARSTIDPMIPADHRLLSVMLPLWMWLLARVYALWPMQWKYQAIWLPAVLLTVLAFLKPAGQLWKTGNGFNHQSWYEAGGPVAQVNEYLSPTSVVYAVDFDFQYWSYLLQRKLVPWEESEKIAPFYLLRYSADLPIFDENHFQVEELVPETLWKITPRSPHE